MKALKIFVAVVLMSVCSMAGSQNLQLLNLWEGKAVNPNSFTIVAHGSGYESGTPLVVQVKVFNMNDMTSATEEASITTR